MEDPTPQESAGSSVPSPSEQFDVQYVLYLQDLVFLHVEHMSWYEMGFVRTQDFMPETVKDVYNDNLYCMSWFYSGALPFDTFEIQYENWLAEQVYIVMMYEET